MIQLLFIIYALFVLLVTKARKGRYLSCCSLFTTIWCFCLVVSSFGLYGLYVPSNTVYIMSVVAMLCFFLVDLIYDGRKTEWEEQSGVLEIGGRFYKWRLVFLNIICFVFSVPYLQKAMEYARDYGLVALRAATPEDIGQNTSVALAFQWLCLPVFTVTIIYAAILFAMKKMDILLLIFAVVDTYIYSMSYGGRYIIAKFLFYFVAAVIIVNRGSVSKILKRNKSILLLGSVALVALVIITQNRSLSGMGWMGNVVGYFTGSFGFLSALLEKNFAHRALGFGYYTFGSPLNLVMAGLKVVFDIEYLGSDTAFSSYAADYLKIGENVSYNSLPTFMYAFILDYGVQLFWIGVVIFAFFSIFFEKRFYKKTNIAAMAMYMFVLFNVFDSVLVYDYLSPGSVVVFLVIWFVTITSWKDRVAAKKEKEENRLKEGDTYGIFR